MSSYFRNTANKADAFASFDSPLFPIKLSGHETLNKAVLFMPRPPSGLQPLRAGDLTPDDIYSFELSILPASADCSIAVDARYVPAMRGEYKISQNMVQQLSAGLKVIVLDESTDSLRGAVLNAP